MSFYNERKLNYIALLLELIIKYPWVSGILLILLLGVTQKPKYALIYLCLYSPLAILYNSHLTIFVVIQWLIVLGYIVYVKKNKVR